jgi:hypothetical protein
MAQKVLTLGEVFEWDSNDIEESRFRDISLLFAEFMGGGDPRIIPFDLFHEMTGVFRRYLRNQSTSVSEFKKYSDRIPSFFARAKKKQWAPDQLLSEGWQDFVQKVKQELREAKEKRPEKRGKEKRYLDLVRFFCRKHLEPNDIRHADLRAWVDDCVIKDYRGYLSAREAAWAFEHHLLDQGFIEVNPKLAKRRKKFSISLDEFPKGTILKEEVEALLKYRMAPPKTWSLQDNEGADLDDDEDPRDSSSQTGEHEDVELSKRRQSRAYTASRLEDIICRLYGFTQNDADHRMEMPTLEDLFTEAVFKKYKKFLVEEREVTARSVFNTFQALIGAARQYRRLGRRAWHEEFEKLLDRETLDEERKRRRKRACLSFDDLEEIPDQIDKKIQKIRERKPSKLTEGFFSGERIEFQVARLEMQKFLMIWMLALAWPSRNLCECRVDPQNSGKVRDPNLFYEAVDEKALPWVYLTDSARESYANGGKVWQFRFSEEETSGCGPVHWALPDVLIEPLKAYLDHRGKLKEFAKDKDADTLFLNTQGRSIQQTTLDHLFIEITLKYRGKRISPQVFRDNWAFEYLLLHEDQFDDLAPMLWHQDSRRTEALYGNKPMRRPTSEHG